MSDPGAAAPHAEPPHAVHPHAEPPHAVHPHAVPRESEPLGVASAPTGDPGVDALMERLTDADALPTAGHAVVYEDVHRGLRDTLTELDAQPGPPPG